MSWAQLTNRPNPGSQRNNNNNNNYHRTNKSYNNRIRPNTNTNANNYHHHRNNHPQQHHYNQTHPHQQHNQYQPRHHHNNNNNNNPQGQPRKIQTTHSKKKHNDIRYVILDSGAFIGRQSFFNNFDANTRYYMTPAVENEIRDKQSRQFLERFPYEIIVKKPDPKSVQYVKKFLANHPNMRSMSKADREIVALVHTLELEHEGNQHLNDTSLTAKKQAEKAMTVIGGNTINLSQKNKLENNAKKDGKQPKKSKSGRAHTELQPMNDTGVRLAMLKKVIPFHFDDFMTLSQQKYGEKYGKPMSNDLMHPPSPARSGVPLKAPKPIPILGELSNDNNDNDREKKPEQIRPKSPQNKNSKQSKKVKYNPKIKAMTECDARSSIDGAKNSKNKSPPSPLSKAQRRRMRKKAAAAQKQEKVAANCMMTEENLLSFQMMDKVDDSSSDDEDDENDDMMKDIQLADIQQLRDDIEAQKQKELETKSMDDNESEKSEIEKMIEEDLTTTFHETASLISSLSEKSSKQFAQLQQMQKRIGHSLPTQSKLSTDTEMPKMTQSHSLPSVAGINDNDHNIVAPIAFGTLFSGQGQLFGIQQATTEPVTAQRVTANASASPAPPPVMNASSSPAMISPGVASGGNVSPAPVMSATINLSHSSQSGQSSVLSPHSPLPPLSQDDSYKFPSQQEKEQKETRPVGKVNAVDAWNGNWLTPENYKPVAKNASKKKTKLKNVSDNNKNSSVAVITIDKTMQQCMSEMGLRVLSSDSNRVYSYGGSTENRQYNNNNNNGNGKNRNGDPIDTVFRCYGCFQFEHDTTRTHCRWCGGQTYQRVMIYQDENGKQHYRYMFRDRYGHKYLEKNSLVPRGNQLVKYNQKNHQNNNNHGGGGRNQNNKKGGGGGGRRHKKRGYLSQNNRGYGGGGQQRGGW